MSAGSHSPLLRRLLPECPTGPHLRQPPVCGTVFLYRRGVPKRLRGIIDKREIELSLDTSDLGVAERRWSSVKAKVDQRLAEAEEGLHSLSSAARPNRLVLGRFRSWAKPCRQECPSS
jgi:hypothetical protein